MAWTSPKTNWTKNDYFNATDFNRIKNNIEYLAAMPDPAIQLVDMGSNRPVGALFYADDINRFQRNLEILCIYIGEDYGDYIDNHENGPIIVWDGLNRIESVIQRIYVVLFGTTPIYAIDANGVYATSGGDRAKARA